MNISRYINKSCKKWKSIATLSACSLVFGVFMAACSDKDLTEPDYNGGTEFTGNLDKLFLALNFELPNGTRTRSETTPGGGSTGTGDTEDPKNTEGGQGNESKIDKFYISFYESSDGGLTLSPIEGNYYEGEMGGNTSVTFETTPAKMKGLAGKEVYVRMMCNLTPDGEIFNMGTNMEAAPLGHFSNSMLYGSTYYVPMANYEEFKVDFTNLKYTEGTTSDSDFIKSLMTILDDQNQRLINLSTNDKIGEKIAGSLMLERCIARLDFRPYNWTYDSTTKKVEATEQIYKIGEIDNNLCAKMYSLQVLNVNRQNYIFRHTAAGDNSEAGDEIQIFGFENSNPFFGKDEKDYNEEELPEDFDNTAYRWIVSCDNQAKKNFYDNEASKNPNWSGPFLTIKDVESGKNITNPYFLNQPTKTVSDPTKSDNEPIFFVHPDTDNKLYGYLDLYNYEDEKEGDTVTREGLISLYKKHYNGGYMSLWYMSENTLPSTDAMIKGLSTGVAFRMLLCDKEGKLLGPDDFTGSKSQPQSRAETDEEENEGGEEEEKGEWLIDGSLDKDDNYSSGKYYILKIGSQEVYAEKISVKDKDGKPAEAYAITYYYFFRHNIDTKNHVLGTVGPMQFGVVRNNIYKLSVTALNGLPEPYDPGDPDEPQKNVISVECNILSWARVDNDDVKL